MQENSEKYSLWDLYFSFQLKNVKMLAEKKKNQRVDKYPWQRVTQMTME